MEMTHLHDFGEHERCTSVLSAKALLPCPDLTSQPVFLGSIRARETFVILAKGIVGAIEINQHPAFRHLLDVKVTPSGISVLAGSFISKWEK